MSVFSYTNIIAIGKFKYLLLWVVHNNLYCTCYISKLKSKQKVYVCSIIFFETNRYFNNSLLNIGFIILILIIITNNMYIYFLELL